MHLPHAAFHCPYAALMSHPDIYHDLYVVMAPPLSFKTQTGRTDSIISTTGKIAQ